MAERRFARQPQIFLVESRSKAWCVIPLDHPLAVHLEHAAGGEPTEQGLTHASQIDAGLPRDRERLADTRERAANRNLIANLAGLTRPRLGSNVNDSLGVAHTLEQ